MGKYQYNLWKKTDRKFVPKAPWESRMEIHIPARNTAAEGIAKMTKRPTMVALVCLLLATVAFYWQILLTRQFSLLTGDEAVRSAYSWFNFWVGNIRQGVLPLWDPYTFGGRSFVGEMQSAAFYPLNLLLALVPFNSQGVFSPQLYHQWIALAHFLGAAFMFALAREMGLSRFASMVAGICFAFGGFVAQVPWPDMVQTAIWLPLIFLFFLRALRAPALRPAISYALLGGLCMGLSILAGRLHVVMMQGMTVVGAAIFAGFHPETQGGEGKPNPWVRPAVAAAGVLAVAFCAGAVQLFPSIEHGAMVIRFVLGGALPAAQKIPYSYFGNGLWPQSWVSLLMPTAFNGTMGAGETINPYLGVFPLLAAMVALWRSWNMPWVRFLGGLAAAAFLFALGEYSLLNGVLYAAIPRLWMAYEVDRYVYLVDFSLAILAGFGVEMLLRTAAAGESWKGMSRVVKGIAIAAAVALAVPAVYGRPDLSIWVAFSLLMILLSCGLFQFMVHGHSGTAVRLLTVALILFDLSGFNWGPRNIDQLGASHASQIDTLMTCRGAARFLKSRPGPFRVKILAEPPPNIGDVFGVPTLSGFVATLNQDDLKVLGNDNLMNAAYIMRPAAAGEPGAAYQDKFWKVYENPPVYGAGWVAHEMVVDPSREHTLSLLNANAVDARRQALLEAPLDAALEPRVEGASETVSFEKYGANRLELTAHAASRGLLVLSEFYWPGWRASVNGQPARIYRVDGVLRGVVVTPGVNRIVLRYAPRSVFAGAILSLLTFIGTPLAVFLNRRPRSGQRP